MRLGPPCIWSIEHRQIIDVPTHVIADRSTVHVAVLVGARSSSSFFPNNNGRKDLTKA